MKIEEPNIKFFREKTTIIFTLILLLFIFSFGFGIVLIFLELNYHILYLDNLQFTYLFY